MLRRPVIPLLLRPYQLRDHTKYATPALPNRLEGTHGQLGAGGSSDRSKMVMPDIGKWEG